MRGSLRWFRVSLRTLFAAFTCVVIALGWLAYSSKLRREALDAVRQAGGEIQFGIGEPSLLEKWYGADSFGSVSKINLRMGDVDNDLLVQIGVVKELRHLDLSNANIDDEGLRRISHLPLRELWLQETDISDASAAILSKMTTLNFLSLNATDLTDTFLEHLETLPQLEDLGLRGTEVTSAGMPYVSRHQKLKKLHLYQTNVGDSGVDHLVTCQSLTSIGLSSTKVTNGVFEHLDKLPNLTDVDLNANRAVTTEAVLAFEKSHPKCDIEWNGK